MSFNVSELFLEAFGLRVDNVSDAVFDGNKPQYTPINYQGLNIVDDDEAVELSALGTPVIYPITLLGGNYKTYTKDGEVQYEAKSEFRLPITCIVDFDRAKIQQRTKINNGAGGTVKETFGFDDWNIVIRGFCCYDEAQAQGFTTPYEQEEELMAWEKIVDSIGVRGKLFNVREITNIVIQKIPMNSLRGKPNLRPFVIHAWSDEPLELIL